jgi:peroxiredoxin
MLGRVTRGRWQTSLGYVVLCSLMSIGLLLDPHSGLAGDNNEPVPVVGQHVDEFTARCSLGREWTLSGLQDKPVVVLVFLGTECPLAKLYAPRLEELHQQYQERGVAFFGVNSNTQDSVTEINAYAQRHQMSFPILKDVGNKIADAVHAQRTPEVFVLDAQRHIRYHGRIDDQCGVGVVREEASRHDLKLALDELLDNKPVSQPETEVVGCFIGRVKNAQSSGDITYSNQIARIFNERCVECHRAGQIAPFTLTSYEDVQGWEDTILEVIDNQRMPPWFANPAHGEFSNDARLSDEEKSVIRQWIENGMPEGDPSQLPDPPEFAEGWRIEEPDQVIYMRDKAFKVPARGVVDYKHFEVDPGWTEDKYISAAEARPGNVGVVHHILVYILSPTGERRPDLRRVLVGYAPGSTPVRLEDGMAIRVPAGSKLLFQMHYTPNGQTQEDRSYIGVRFMDKQDVKKLRQGRLAINTDLKIPPRAREHVVTSAYEVGKDELLLGMTPHMHLRGKAFRYEATYPDGKQEILLDVPQYDFNWQLKYILAEPKLLPRGTKVLCTAVYDNSEDNFVNPNPNKTVGWGDQSNEEMMIGFFDVTSADGGQHGAQKSRDVKHDPTGEWRWTRREGLKSVEDQLTLQLKNDQLTGTLHAGENVVEIQDAVVDGERLKFVVELEQLGGLVLNFDAKISPEKIDGEVTFTVQTVGRSQTFPWHAERRAAASPRR